MRDRRTNVDELDAEPAGDGPALADRFPTTVSRSPYGEVEAPGPGSHSAPGRHGWPATVTAFPGSSRRTTGPATPPAVGRATDQRNSFHLGDLVRTASSVLDSTSQSRSSRPVP